LQLWLPEHHTAERSRDMVGGGGGLLTLLLGLVLGPLIWTSYGVYNAQQTDRALEFDIEMRQYGPEADRNREALRNDLVWAHEQFWGDDLSRAASYDASYKAMGRLNEFFDSLEPKTPSQTQLLAARGNYGFIGEQRILMSMQAATTVAWPLIYAVTFWSCLMFGGMGLLSKFSPMAAAMLVLGAESVGLAIILILEFNMSYTSSIARVSPAPLEQAIVELDKPGPTASGTSH
jgi:hypothetical protein